MKPPTPSSAIDLLVRSLEQQKYRPELRRFVAYQERHYHWVRQYADVHTGQPAIVQLVACIIDDAEFRAEFVRVQSELLNLCRVTHQCDAQQSMKQVRQQLIGDRQFHQFPDGTIGLQSDESSTTDVFDVGSPPPIPEDIPNGET